MSLVASDQATLSIDPGTGEISLLGLTRRQMVLSHEAADRSHVGSPGWRERTLLGAHPSVELRAEGILVAGNGLDALRTAFLNGEPAAFALHLPGDGVWRAAFVITRLAMSARPEEEWDLSLRLLSTGPVTFTPDP